MERNERVYGVFKWSSMEVGVGCGASEAWGEFTAELSAAHVRELVTLVKSLDPAHETHSNPYCCTVNTLTCGLDPWLIAREQDSIGVSIHPHHMFEAAGEAVRDYPSPVLSVTSTALAILSCSACDNKSAATNSALDFPSATTRISLGPAIISMDTSP